MTLCHSLPALLCLKGWSFGLLHRCCHGEAGMGAAGLCLLHPAYLFAWDWLKNFFLNLNLNRKANNLKCCFFYLSANYLGLLFIMNSFLCKMQSILSQPPWSSVLPNLNTNLGGLVSWLTATYTCGFLVWTWNWCKCPYILVRGSFLLSPLLFPLNSSSLSFSSPSSSSLFSCCAPFCHSQDVYSGFSVNGLGFDLPSSWLFPVNR